ncbi:hypothetical protein [Paraclostridium sordellii]|uniref:hypothetical protein n=1 Tax=Paraclostridium sordellii TaxID=1505 RepID=UPI0005E87E95|nr:hypothetical protein [Paeniclostridium sordellii]MDU6247319.1 hypothetical protein [Paeniclostridium sordellii]MVO70943.1 hypothetical protein [Paeniclostridium sordellii]CEO27106.1 group I intron endonuclease [[Clostridium] sordellii] [Paeniclostridium sordellii]CEP42887.1 group I intron endonuclease [[Clostridium] sordellii] [Paeniclostridium sordellii]
MKYSNTYDFDFTENYMALLACILNPKLSIGKAIKHIILEDARYGEGGAYRNIKSPKKSYNYRARVTDEVENKVYEFNTLNDCCKFLNIRRSDITIYIKHKIKFKKRYMIEVPENIERIKCKEVRITDTLKNEIIEIKSINKACEYLNASRGNLKQAIEAKRLFRQRYKIEIKDNKKFNC